MSDCTPEEADSAEALLRCLHDWVEVDEMWEAHYTSCLHGETSRAEEKEVVEDLLENHTRPQCQRALNAGFMPSVVQDIMLTFGDKREGLRILQEFADVEFDLEIPF